MNGAGTARLPWALRAMNRAGAALRGLGIPLLPLPEARLVESLENEAGLTPLGRQVARTDLRRVTANRLRILDTVRRNPEISEAPVVAPIFIVGAPRTGTSILHELLAQDPAVRVPRTWEVMYPWPPPEQASHASDPRIAEVDGHYEGIDRLLPEFKRMHAMGAELPQECAVLTAHEAMTMVWHTQFNVPSYQAWFEAADHRETYAGHKRQLRYLQWRCPGAPWVLKSPQHLWTLDALFEVYPDARIVQTHRDPLRIVASLTSLCAMLRSMTSERIDPAGIGRDWVRRLSAGLEHTMKVRDAGVPAGQVYDLQFRDFVGHEIEAIRKLYAHFGMTLAAEAEARMGRFLAANSRDQRGRHRYGLSDAGLDEATERPRFAAYQDRHRVPSEDVG